MRVAALTLAVCLAASAALAQAVSGSSVSSSATMATLLADGYEIKAAVPNGSSFVVFLQKDKSAYACEFNSVTSSRCRSIN
ncbi:hypothetical protein J5J10_10050 [Ciceribacter sp. L1K23]|uniref:hypothetical protein n=1 Tax=unclassified Ciceribacter TaxID=2628820 RepID=UPI001ABE73F5|nr:MULTISPECIES: hypothetical protein [unclassified Ciceribacter]MBO3759827.1 hypothetical protein [Ciceribacter sp. L1K22]MBR0556020.1 hypothetical protein [Ciceribacter sp. L1K23]